MRNKILLIISLVVLFYLMIPTKRYLVKNQKIINCKDCFVVSEENAINIAEAIAFDVYGEEKIKNERPYTVKLINNKVWQVRGSLCANKTKRLLAMCYSIPIHERGFEILINSEDCKIMKVIDYK